MNNKILALVFLVAGVLLTIGTTTIMVPAAYAGGDDDDGNKNKADVDDSSFRSFCESFVG